MWFRFLTDYLFGVNFGALVSHWIRHIVHIRLVGLSADSHSISMNSCNHSKCHQMWYLLMVGIVVKEMRLGTSHHCHCLNHLSDVWSAKRWKWFYSYVEIRTVLADARLPLDWSVLVTRIVAVAQISCAPNQSWAVDSSAEQQVHRNQIRCPLVKMSHWWVASALFGATLSWPTPIGDCLTCELVGVGMCVMAKSDLMPRKQAK